MSSNRTPIMAGVTTSVMDEVNAAHLAKIKPHSVIMFAHNYESPEQMKKLIQDVKDAAGKECLVTIDHEGGRVTRFPGGTTHFPAPRLLAEGGPELVYKHAKRAGAELKEWGFDMNLAPVVDVLTPYSHPRMIYRCFGNDIQLVCEMTESYIKGMADGGVQTVAKHFPGVGAAELDPHETRPTVMTTEAEQEPYLAPFKSAVDAGVDGIMTSHILYANIDPDWPCTLSPTFVNGWIREKLGFKGLVLSDDLEMGAIMERHSIEEALLQARTAGCDIGLICKDMELQSRAAEVLKQ